MLDADPAKRPTDLKLLAESLVSRSAPVKVPAKRSFLRRCLLWSVCAALLAAVGLAGWMVLLSSEENVGSQSKAVELDDAFSIPESVK
jgi:hypothetical protein